MCLYVLMRSVDSFWSGDCLWSRYRWTVVEADPGLPPAPPKEDDDAEAEVIFAADAKVVELGEPWFCIVVTWNIELDEGASW